MLEISIIICIEDGALCIGPYCTDILFDYAGQCNQIYVKGQLLIASSPSVTAKGGNHLSTDTSQSLSLRNFKY